MDQSFSKVNEKMFMVTVWLPSISVLSIVTLIREVTMFTSGIRRSTNELFPTDVQIPVCLWDGLNYVQSNCAHIQCYLQIPMELTTYWGSCLLNGNTLHRVYDRTRPIRFYDLAINKVLKQNYYLFECNNKFGAFFAEYFKFKVARM